MSESHRAAGDPIPSDCERIEVHVAELRQLFNAMDPSPFRKRDLDPNAEEFIVGWAREAPRAAHLGMVVHLDRAPGLPNEAIALRGAVHEFFAGRAQVTRRRLRELFRRGRISLLIGLVALSVLFGLSDVIGDALAGWGVGEALRESVLIGGWVAMWRPLEIFLYDWWPIRAEVRLYDRLGSMPVRIAYEGEVQAWQSDWPATPPGARSPREEAVPR